jgi:choline dehydrogenase-like flavoprotein
MTSYDVIIIGTGAGGGTLARHLAPSGKRILLLERGDWLPREAQNWLARDVFVDNRYVSPDTWYDAKGQPFQPQIHYFVGGATKLYGAALYRFRKEDFGELRHQRDLSRLAGLLRRARALLYAGTAVTEVIVERNGGQERFAADVVVVSCGAANSAKLLLASASDRHPNGLANGSDQVGRNYMFHASQAVLALSREENPTVFQKTLALNDFYFSSDDFEYPLGNIQMVGKSQAPMFRGEKPRETKLAPKWTLERIAKHVSTSGSRPRICPGPRIGSPSSATATSSSPTPRPMRSRRSASSQSSGRCSASWT